MVYGEEEYQLLAQAIGGDLLALQALLAGQRPRLLSYLRRHLPADTGSLMEPEDLLQDTFVEAFRRIGSFVPEGPDPLYRWLVTIARNRLVHLIRNQRAAKRGGGRKPLMRLLEQYASLRRSPSRSAAAHEAATAVEQCLQRVPEPYRQALCLRYLEGFSPREAAEKMQRTEHAFHMLCNRGLKALRQELRSASLYL